MTVRIERVGDTRDELGEGPLWDVRNQLFYWVDSRGCLIHRLDPETGVRRDWATPSMIGSMALRERGGAIVALESGFFTFDFDTEEATPIAEPEADDARTRMNDGKVDRQGRFIAGSMGTVTRDVPLGTLYRLDPDGTVTELDHDIGVSNGPCFSPDGRTFYFSDSAARLIYAYDYDTDTGTPTNRRVFADLGPLNTAPDGCTVDAAGNVWSAMVRSGQIGCFAPDGKLLRTIDMPCRLPSSAMFGGPKLDRLYVTSISKSANVESDGPEDGGLYVIDGLDAVGLPEPYFDG